MNKYYAKNSDEVVSLLESDKEKGLSLEKVSENQQKYGFNVLPHKKSDSIVKIFFRQIFNPIILLLIITIIFSLIVAEYIDAIAIVFIVLLDLCLGTYQEWRASKNAQSLQDLIKYKVRVIRDNKKIVIDSEELVVGDIVLLESGDKIGADMRIIEQSNLQVDEAVLTGESVNVYKTSKLQSSDAILSERKNMVYAGCNVVVGRAKCIVCEVGINTEVGKIAKQVTSMKDEKSPLTIRMEKLSKQISLLVIIVAIIITTILFIKDIPGKEIFLSVVALSVSAMPEGLPLALTMALSITSNNMAKKNVICKKLNSVESLGSCTVIATDKTGTLTVNEQTAKKIVLPSGREFDIEGVGYDFNGTVKCDLENKKHCNILATLGCLNNEASIEKKNDQYQYLGDSIDLAFRVLGEKLNVSLDSYEIIGRIPYESENKYSAVFYKYNNEVYCTVKGSCETILDFSKKMIIDDNIVDIDTDKLIEQNELLANDGYRVICLGYGKVDNFQKKDFYSIEDIPNIVYLGMVSFIDPIRKEVSSAISECCDASIKVIMITGDHPLTALSIAKSLNLAHSIHDVATGRELAEYYAKGELIFDEFIKGKTVFARVTPTDKLNIVNSLKRSGEFVAVTGDGVNDAPAIKSANIGIAMGSGTDVAKETASMIIADDNFRSIVSGVKLGRTAYSNIRKVCYLLLSCGLAEVMFFVLSIICNLPMPLVAIQLLWLNLVTDGLQDFAVSFEKSETGIMKEKPLKSTDSIFNKELLIEVLLSGITIGLIVFVVWYFLLIERSMEIAHARGYILALMVFMQNVHVINCRSEKKSAFNLSFKTNPLILFTIISSIILQVIVMEVPILSEFLQAYTIPYGHLIYLFGFSLIVFVVMEIYKLIRYNNYE